MNTASQQVVKGLDLGTSRIVLATLNGEEVDFSPQLNAFVDIPYSKMTEQMLSREHILHQVDDDHIYVYGNRADEFAKFLDGDTRHPMQGGLLNPTDQECADDRTAARATVRQGVGGREAVPQLAECTARSRLGPHLPRALGARHLRETWLSGEGDQRRAGCCLFRLKDANFTGIGMSFGAGMCNMCVAYLGLPVLSVATTRAGDYIDHSAASVTGETPTTVRLHKENGFTLDGMTNGPIDRALCVYYADVIETAVEALQNAMAELKKLPNFHRPIPLVCAGGTAMARDFLPRLQAMIGEAELPVRISDVYLAKDPLNATAKGALVGAMLNM